MGIISRQPGAGVHFEPELGIRILFRRQSNPNPSSISTVMPISIGVGVGFLALVVLVAVALWRCIQARNIKKLNWVDMDDLSTETSTSSARSSFARNSRTSGMLYAGKVLALPAPALSPARFKGSPLLPGFKENGIREEISSPLPLASRPAVDGIITEVVLPPFSDNAKESLPEGESPSRPLSQISTDPFAKPERQEHLPSPDSPYLESTHRPESFVNTKEINRFQRSVSLSRKSTLRPVARLMAVTIKYIPSLPDELLLNGGEIVRMLEEYSDGWCFVKRVNTGDEEEGVVPRVCLSEYSGEGPPSSFPFTVPASSTPTGLF